MNLFCGQSEFLFPVFFHSAESGKEGGGEAVILSNREHTLPQNQMTLFPVPSAYSLKACFPQ